MTRHDHPALTDAIFLKRMKNTHQNLRFPKKKYSGSPLIPGNLQ